VNRKPPAVPDDVVDRLEPRFISAPWLTELTGPDPIPDPLLALGSIGDWDDARVLLRAASRGASGNTDAQSFGWQRDAYLVVSHPVGDSVSVSIPAFRRLMRRIADVLIEGAEASDDPVMGDDETWPAILEARELLVEESPAFDD
jgi:hypothetical protein